MPIETRPSVKISIDFHGRSRVYSWYFTNSRIRVDGNDITVDNTRTKSLVASDVYLGNIYDSPLTVVLHTVYNITYAV